MKSVCLPFLFITFLCLCTEQILNKSIMCMCLCVAMAGDEVFFCCLLLHTKKTRFEKSEVTVSNWYSGFDIFWLHFAHDHIKLNRIASTFKSNKEPYLLKFRSDYLTIITSVASNSRGKLLFFRNKFFCFSLRRSISIGCVLCSLIKYLHCINIPDSHAFSFLFFSDCIIFCSRVLNAICCHSKIQAGWKDNFVTNNRLGRLMMVSWLPLTQRKHWWVSGVLGENMCRESERTY